MRGIWFKKRLCQMLISTWINDQNKIGSFFVQKLSDDLRVRTRPLSVTFCTNNEPILFWSFIHMGISIRLDLFFKQIPRVEFYKSSKTIFSKINDKSYKKIIFCVYTTRFVNSSKNKRKFFIRSSQKLLFAP